MGPRGCEYNSDCHQDVSCMRARLSRLSERSKDGLRALGSEQGRRGASMGTPANRMHAATVLGQRTRKYGVVVVPTPADSVEFLKSTQDVKARNAAKEHTNEVRSGGRDPGDRWPPLVSVSRQHARSSFVPQCTRLFP